jgi:threonine synthase
MQYVSTRGRAGALDFEGATLAGLASDGGLYLPEHWPTFSADDLAAMRGLSYVETAVRIIAPFVGESLSEAELRSLCTQAYGRFAHAAVRRSSSSITSTGCWSCSTARRWRSRMWRCNCSACSSRSS